MELVCPVCGKRLQRGEKEYRCENRHSFDIARQGHVNLLVVQQNLVRASTINKAITSLQKGKAELIGCVLNNVFSLAYVAPRTAGTGYGYGYGHYGNYGKNKKATASTGKRSGS